MEERIVMPEVRENYDLDYYIQAVKDAEERSKDVLWRSVYKQIKTMLEDAKRKHTPMLDVADKLLQEVGEQTKNEPVSLSAYRVVSYAVLTKQKVSLL